MSILTATASAVKPIITIVIKGALYDVEQIPAGEFGVAAVRLTKRSMGGETYDVVLTGDGRAECDCPSYEFTHRGTAGTCKHGAACLGRGLLSVAGAVEAEEPVALAADDESACPVSEDDHRAWEARQRGRRARFTPSAADQAEWAILSYRLEQEAEERANDARIDREYQERMEDAFGEPGHDWHEAERIEAVGCIEARLA